MTRFDVVDDVLRAHAGVLGGDFAGYRHHVYRVANLCLTQAPASPIEAEKIATAAVFHDLGIWADRTFAYLEPSVALARAHLARAGRSAWAPEIAMIREHHKLSQYHGDDGALVERFRRADWIDVTFGARAFGVPRWLVRDLFHRWPDAGFHGRLVQLVATRLLTHPWNPLPMVRL